MILVFVNKKTSSKNVRSVNIHSSVFDGHFQPPHFGWRGQRVYELIFFFFYQKLSQIEPLYVITYSAAAVPNFNVT